MPRTVAVTQRVEWVESYGEVRDALDQEWITWLESEDLIPVPVPNAISDVAAYCTSLGIEGVVLTGGNNIGGSVYVGDPPSGGVSEARDSVEEKLVNYAIESEIPVMAWCRGLQFLQVFFGGKLKASPSTISHVASTHEVDIISPSHQHLAPRGSIVVNSFHDFAVGVKDLAPDLEVLAVSSPDDLVEAVFHRTLPIIGCQWHPERPDTPDEFNRAILRSLFPEVTAT